MPIRSYLESPAAKVILDGKPFATVSVSRRYYGYNLASAAKARRERRRTVQQRDTLRGRRRTGQVHDVVARLHEAWGATRSRHGNDNAAPQPKTRLRGTGEDVRRRPRGRSSTADRCRRLSGIGPPSSPGHRVRSPAGMCDKRRDFTDGWSESVRRRPSLTVLTRDAKRLHGEHGLHIRYGLHLMRDAPRVRDLHRRRRIRPGRYCFGR